ncbi:MAG: YggT family protein [Candidatus Dasytiphilus stammeri]
MFMSTLYFHIKIIIHLYIMVLLLRSWLHIINYNYENAFVETIIKITDPVIEFLRYTSGYKNNFIKTSALIIIAFLLSTLKFPLVVFIQEGLLPFLSYASIMNLIIIGLITFSKSIGLLIIEVITLNLFRRWILDDYYPIDAVLEELSESVLNPIRTIIPVVWEIDFSPLILVIIIYLINYLCWNLFPIMWQFV